MAQRSFILLAAVLAAMIFGSVGVYAYDSSNDGEIAKGISAAGIDIGGLKEDEARDKLRRELAYNLERPLTVKYRGRRFKLDPKRADIRTNVDSMVDEALAKSRQGNVISRSLRSLTGGDVHADIPVEVSYSKKAVTALVARVKRDIDQPARDATIQMSGSGVSPVPGRNGHELDARALSSAIGAALVEPSSRRVIKAHVTVTHPKVTTRELASKYPKVITVDRAAKTLRLFVNLKPAATYRIAVGQVGLETPAGQYAIQDKQVNPSWHVPNSDWAGDLAGRVIPPGPSNPLKARWMGIFGGAGIHGTADIGSLGSAASHGCIRMAVPDVIQLFDRVDVGTPVFIS
jgi:lipoprotein-anchoring transpeptidase ErfK/SrfK